MDVHLYTPNDYVGGLMDLCQNKRGVLIDMKYLDDVRVDLHYALPLGEIVYDFFDAIKSRSRGYASYDYEFKEYRESDLVKLDFLLNGDPVDALSMIVFRDNAYAKGRRICEKLRDNIPRNLFEIPVQVAIGGKIIARETVKAMRKDVLAKCYGGDISRKRSCWKSRRKAKRRCVSWAAFPCPVKPLPLCSSWTATTIKLYRSKRTHALVCCNAPGTRVLSVFLQPQFTTKMRWAPPFGETYLFFRWDYFATVPLRWGVRGRLQSLDCSFPICFCPDYT